MTARAKSRRLSTVVVMVAVLLGVSVCSGVYVSMNQRSAANQPGAGKIETLNNSDAQAAGDAGQDLGLTMSSTQEFTIGGKSLSGQDPELGKTVNTPIIVAPGKQVPIAFAVGNPFDQSVKDVTLTARVYRMNETSKGNIAGEGAPAQGVSLSCTEGRAQGHTVQLDEMTKGAAVGCSLSFNSAKAYGITHKVSINITAAKESNVTGSSASAAVVLVDPGYTLFSEDGVVAESAFGNQAASSAKVVVLQGNAKADNPGADVDLYVRTQNDDKEAVFTELPPPEAAPPAPVVPAAVPANPLKTGAAVAEGTPATQAQAQGANKETPKAPPAAPKGDAANQEQSASQPAEQSAPAVEPAEKPDAQPTTSKDANKEVAAEPAQPITEEQVEAADAVAAPKVDYTPAIFAFALTFIGGVAIFFAANFMMGRKSKES